jgi:hypothetical protein
MNNLTYTITNEGFQFKSLLYKQYRNKFEWSNEETKGQVNCGELLPGFYYNLIDFHAHDSLALNYHPKDVDGFLFIINRLSTSGYVQLMTESNLMVDYSPRNIEIYTIPADKLFSFTYAPATTGKRIEFFVKTEALKNGLSPTLLQVLKHKPFLPFSELLNDTLYNELCNQLDSLFGDSINKVHLNIVLSLLSILNDFNEFVEKTTLLNTGFPYKTALNLERHFSHYKRTA